MKLLILDNYDSFTYNLSQLIKENSNAKVEVRRNDEISLAEVQAYDRIVLSSGTGIPIESGILCELIKTYKHSKSILGVGLGMHAINEVYGSSLIHLEEPAHGIVTPIKHFANSFIFKEVPKAFNAGRYHSWALDATSLPKELVVTAMDESGVVMAVEHREFALYGLQFHPESILTEYGKIIMTNFLND